MPATPSQLRRRTTVHRTVEFVSDEGSAEVTFSYDRNKITDSWLTEWTELERGREGHAMNEVLLDLLISWDIQEEDGSPVPITIENLSALFNIPDKVMLIGELISGAQPTRAEGEVSSAGSGTPSTGSASKQGNHLDGQLTSPLPPPLASPSPT